MKNILVVDDDEYLREQIYWAFKKESYRLLQAGSRAQMCRIMNKTSVDLVLLDLHLPPEEDTPEEGMRALEEIKKIHPEIKVVVMTGDQEEETSLRVINNGAYDYFSKPFDLEEMKIVLKRALYIQSLERENRRLREELSRKVQFANIIGKSDRMKSIFEMIRIVAQSECAVLIRGESGTGKELAARAIHYNSQRKEEPFVVVNCAALPETLLESELFGYNKGAFTGADTAKPGKFELAHKGTLFLDEISDMSPAMQAKILRVLQEQSFERVGGIQSIKVDVRILAATNKDLEKLLSDGSFREDLYYRLKVVSIFLPPLRERKEDIPLLANYFLKKYSRKNNKNIRGISSSAMTLLKEYDWPGNVRELENVIERAVVLTSEDIILPQHLPSDLGKEKKKMSDFFFINFSLDELEKILIENTLKNTNWNRKKAAEKLGIHWNTLHYKIKKFVISPGEQKAKKRSLPFSLRNLSFAEAKKKLILKALKYTQGNILEASQILGIHRNTLLKKMKEFRT